MRRARRLALLLGLLLCVPACVDSDSVPVEAVPGAAGSSEAAEHGDRIVLSGSAKPIKVRLRLPQGDPEQGPVRLWLARDMVDEIHLEAGSWRSPTYRFFAPEPGEPLWPSGFSFSLPPAPVDEVVLVASSSAAATLRPRLRAHADTAWQQQQLVGLASALYAVLAVLALVALSLFLAVRDHAYLALLAFCAGALGWLMAANGHLYTLPGLRLAGGFGVQGAWALLLLLGAASIWVAQRYAELRQRAPRLHAIGNRLLVGLLVLAGACLLGLAALLDAMRWLSGLGWLAAAAFALAAAVVAVRARLWNSMAILALLLLTVVGAVARALAKHGIGPDDFWTRYGYQMGLAGCAFLLTIGLIARIARVRAERDHERRARGDSERRLQHEAARVALSQQLQERLRDLQAAGDMDWMAFRLLFAQLQPLLRLDAGALVTRGYHGTDQLLAEPVESQAHFIGLVDVRQSELRGFARGQAPVVLPLGEMLVPGQYAVIPLPIRAPAWGVLLLLRRSDDQQFRQEELVLAHDFAQLMIQQAEEALATANLRRSAELDALTATHNRRTTDLWLARCFGEAHRSGQSLSVLFVDLDHFKSINDTHGHAAGDVCLRHVADVLRQQLDSSDILGRYGGEEFLLILPGRDGDAARRLGERMRDAVERTTVEIDGKTVRLTVSIGVAPRLPDEAQPAAAVERADKALYTAKRSGRNRVCVAPAVFS